MSPAWLQASWELVRASGFTAYLLLTVSVVLGLLLSLRWQSRRWPRLVTNEMHNFLTLWALAFGMVHGLIAWLDPFTRFGLAEVLVPLQSHYRPLWIAFGIVSLYLGLALVLTTWLRPWIGYRLWRALHLLAFLVFAFTTLHGIGTGSDTRTVWGALIYAISVLVVLALTAWRLVRPAGRRARGRPGLAALTAGAAAALALWAGTGPMRAGWNAVANHSAGSGARIALRAPVPAQTLPARFTAPFSGAIRTGGSGDGGELDDGQVDASLTATFSGNTAGGLAVLVAGQRSASGIAIARSQVTLYAADGQAVERGTVRGATGQTLIALVAPVHGRGPILRLAITWRSAGRTLTGRVVTRPFGAVKSAGGGPPDT